MGILWQLETDQTHYSVRNSGASIRLYTNRVFHSQWNPGMPFAGGIWDCLSLPALYRDPGSVQRVLLLGLGGGTVILQLKRLIAPQQIIGIECDEQHLVIARQWFGLDSEDNIDLVHDNAIQWIDHYSDHPFDIIIDDLFGHSEGEPVRACKLEADWLERLRGNLVSDGLLVVNCINAKQLSEAIPCFDDAGFRFGYRWSMPAYENVIATVSAASLHARQWSRHLEASQLNTAAQRQARSIARRPIRGLGKR